MNALVTQESAQTGVTAQQTITQAETLVSALQALPPSVKAKIGYEGVFNALLSAQMNGGDVALAQAALDKARAGVESALESPSLDAGTRAVLEGLLGEIDSGTGVGDNEDSYNLGNRNDYRETFFSMNPELRGRVVVHHGIEQQVLRRPETAGLFNEEEIHAYENLRGIPNEINSELHLSQIRKEWNRFYKENPNPTREQVLQKRVEIDRKYGHLFNPRLF